MKEGARCSDDEIRRFCREHMADYKVPKQVLFLDSLPKDGNGRVLKEKLGGFLPPA